jgi:hypothetical protein
MWIFAFILHSALALDPLAFISDDTKRSEIEKAQHDVIKQRTDLGTSNCTELFADLPFENGTKTPFITAFGTIQTMLGWIKYWDQQCLRQLAQNLATLNNPIALRVAGEVLDTSLEKSVTPKATYCAPATSGIEQILALSQNVDRIRKCTPLERGKWKTVSGSSKSGIDYNYGLVQEAPNKIKAVLNVEFTGNSDGVTEKIMLNRARGCLNSIQSGLKGPSGEKLAISLLTPEEVRLLPANLRPKKTTITIAASNARSHSKAYASSIDCPVILHEVLHLLGLCDEYPGEGDNYPCRAVGNRDSIMRNQWQTFGTALPENLLCACETPDCTTVIADPAKLALLTQPTYYDVIPTHFRNRYCALDASIYRKRFADGPLPTSAYTPRLESELRLKILSAYNPTALYYDEAAVVCECPATDQECKADLQAFARPAPGLRPLSCPDPTTLKATTIGARPVAEGVQGNTLHIHRPALKPSLLEPRHFNRIMAGNCESQTKNYERCAEFAYETSKVACEQAPAQCLNNTTWGK